MMRSRLGGSMVVLGAGVLLAFAGCSSDDGDGSGVPQAGMSSGQAGSASGATTTGGAAPTSGASNTGGMTAAGAGGASAAGATNAGGGGSAGSSTAGAGAGGTASGGAGGAGGAAGNGGTAGAGGGSTGRSAGCGKAPTIAADMYNNGKNIPITAANLQRRYILSVPTNYDNNKAYKLVIAYHQRDGNDNQMYKNKYYHLQPLSNDSTIFVAPNGQKNGAPCTGTGDAESGCGWPNPNDQDLALADAVVKQVEDNFCIDTNRIFATGWSFGGSMSYATACKRPLGATGGFIRAVAVYSGSQLSGNCTPTTPVGYYASHGTSDSVLCYDETKANGCQVGNGEVLAENFAKANGCTWAKPTKVTSGNHVCTKLMGCKTGYPEEFCSFNGDHTPDQRDPGQQTSWNYQEAWDFLNQF